VQVPVGTVVHLVSGSVPSLEQSPVTPDHTTWEHSKIPDHAQGAAGAISNDEESSEISAAWLDNLFLDNAKARLLAKNSSQLVSDFKDQQDEHGDGMGASGGQGKVPVAEAPLSSPADDDEHLVIDESRVGEEEDQLLHCSREGQRPSQEFSLQLLAVVVSNAPVLSCTT